MNASIHPSASAATAVLTPEGRVFRLPLPLGLLFCIVLFGVFAAGGIAIAVAVYRQGWGMSLFFGLLAGFAGAMADVFWRQYTAARGLRVALGADAVTLDLPAGRSLGHRPPTQHLTIPYADIAGIEARYEAHKSLGQEYMQRDYALRRSDGKVILLFEDRWLKTGSATSYFPGIAAELAARAGGTIHELGTVECKAGILGMWGIHAPDWGASTLPRERVNRVWQDTARTGSVIVTITALSTALGVLLQALNGVFGR